MVINLFFSNQIMSLFFSNCFPRFKLNIKIVDIANFVKYFNAFIRSPHSFF